MVILLIFIAIGIFWFVTRNVIEESTGQFELGSKCLSIDVSATAATCVGGVCNVTYTRSAGGDAIDGIKLILSDGTTSFEEDIEGDVGSLETKTEVGIDTNITAPTSVEVAVYFEDASGTKQLCTQTNVFNFA
ncbi:MAG TPA: hypothetical protein VMZ91_03470 [Candidatus Paceibacterota bacterium]|nr:hypothetical protein [Candidatus Paceibacterota bacterium]